MQILVQFPNSSIKETISWKTFLYSLKRKFLFLGMDAYLIYWHALIFYTPGMDADLVYIANVPNQAWYKRIILIS